MTEAKILLCRLKLARNFIEDHERKAMVNQELENSGLTSKEKTWVKEEFFRKLDDLKKKPKKTGLTVKQLEEAKEKLIKLDQ